MRHLAPPAGVTKGRDDAPRALLQRMNARHWAEHPGDTKLAALIASYELAARLQLSVPVISDLSTEPAHILNRYGADDAANPTKAAFAKNCILARRLIERGVRFVQLFKGAYASGGELNWDGHNKLKEQKDKHAEILDQPEAALIHDLKQRGAGEYACRLVSRVWPDADVPERLTWARSQPGRLHLLAHGCRGSERGESRGHR